MMFRVEREGGEKKKIGEDEIRLYRGFLKPLISLDH